MHGLKYRVKEMKGNNYFLLLGIRFDPPETNETVIREAVYQYIKKGQESEKPQREVLAQEMLNLLLEPDRCEERMEQAENAAMIIYAPLDEEIKNLADRSVPPALSLCWASKIAAATGFDQEIVTRRMLHSSEILIPVKDDIVVEPSALTIEIDGLLKKKREDSLESYLLRFIDPSVKTLNIWALPDHTLYEAVNLAQKKSRTPEEARLSEILMKFLNFQDLREQYKRDLALLHVLEIAKKATTLDQNGLLRRSKEESAEIYQQIQHFVSSPQTALELFQALFFHPLVLPLPIKKKASRDVTICCSRCGGLQRITRNSKMVCTFCGTSLNVTCKKCGTIYLRTNYDTACPQCLYDPRVEKYAKKLLQMADDAREIGNREEYYTYRKKALRLAPDIAWEVIRADKQKLVDQVALLKKKRHFYALRDLLSRSDEFQEHDKLMSETNAVIDWVETAFSRLPEQEPEAQYRILHALSQICGDIPGLSARAACFIPPAPSQLKIDKQDETCTLSWHYPDYPEAQFEIACRIPLSGRSDAWEEVICENVPCSPFIVSQLGFGGEYIIRASLFGQLSPWTSIAVQETVSPTIEMKAELQQDGMLISWQIDVSHRKTMLKKIVDGIEQTTMLFNPDTDCWLDVEFHREKCAEYRLTAYLDTNSQTYSIIAGLSEKNVALRLDDDFIHQYVFEYTPDSQVDVAWIRQDRGTEPLKAGVYAMEELSIMPELHFEKAATGIQRFHPSPRGHDYIQPVWKGGGCLRVGKALMLPCIVSAFQSAQIGQTQKGLYSITADWPADASTAIVTACATHNAEPDQHHGEITLRFSRDKQDYFSATIPWSLTPYVCITLYAGREVEGEEFWSEPLKYQTQKSFVLYNIDCQGEHSVLRVHFEAREHTVCRPALGAVSKKTGNVIPVVNEGILFAGNDLDIYRLLPQPAENWDIVWCGPEHDLFELMRYES